MARQRRVIGIGIIALVVAGPALSSHSSPPAQDIGLENNDLAAEFFKARSPFTRKLDENHTVFFGSLNWSDSSAVATAVYSEKTWILEQAEFLGVSLNVSQRPAQVFRNFTRQFLNQSWTETPCGRTPANENPLELGPALTGY